MTSNADSTAASNHQLAEFEQVSREQWMEAAIAGLRLDDSVNAPLQSIQQTTLDGLPIDVLYDTCKTDFTLLAKSGSHNAVDNRVAVKVEDTPLANKAITDALAGGANSVQLDIHDEHSLKPVLNGVHLHIAPVCVRSGDRFAQSAAAFIDLAKSSGAALDSIQGLLAADPVGVMLSGNSGERSLSAQLTALAEHAQSVATTLPGSRSVLIDSVIHHNAGASAVDELHAALATSVVYLEAMLDSGMSIENASQQIVFQLGMDSDVLLGVAKLRALQSLWQRLLSAFDSTYIPATAAKIIAETSQRQLSLLQPWNNHLRNLAASTAALLGSADTLLVHPHDVLQTTQNPEQQNLSKRMARNIAIILERESGLCKVDDPFAGSYAMENLTEQLAQLTWQSLSTTDTSAGWLDEINSGRWQSRLNNTHQRRVDLITQEKTIAVGVNRYVFDSEKVEAPVERKESLAPTLPMVREASVVEKALAAVDSEGDTL